MKRLRAPARARGVAGGQEFVHRLGRHAAAEHGVVDAFARGRGHDAGGVAGQHHVAAVVPARQRLQRDRRAFAAHGLRPSRPLRLAQRADGVAQREALVGAAGADARRVAVREDPAVEVGRELAAVIDVAARARRSRAALPAARARSRGRRRRRARARRRHRLARHRGARAVGADDAAGAHRSRRSCARLSRRGAEVHHADAVVVALDPLEGAGAPHRAVRWRRARAAIRRSARDRPCRRSRLRWRCPRAGRRRRPCARSVTRATSSSSGMSKSWISRGGIAPPQGLMRPARSSSSTLWPWRARSSAAVAPAGPPPTTTTSKRVSSSMHSWLTSKLAAGQRVLPGLAPGTGVPRRAG